MQGIFEFAGATLSWGDEIHPSFPFAGTLETPHRWAGKNPELGQWIAETRLQLIRGEVIDLYDPRINYREYNDARSDEHTSELQSLIRISLDYFSLKKKKSRTTLY